MIDSFITTNYQREYYRSMTKHALYLSGLNPICIEKPMLERYFKCEEVAQTSIYIFSDDDVVPATQDTLAQLVVIMREHPEYSQLGLSWKSNMITEENNPWIINKEKDIWEMNHVGGIMAIRKGTIKDLGDKVDYTKGIGDDKIMGKVARELGYKVGIVPHLYFHHLGQNYSTVWK